MNTPEIKCFAEDPDNYLTNQMKNSCMIGDNPTKILKEIIVSKLKKELNNEK